MQVLLKADDEGESGDQLKGTGHGDSFRRLNPGAGRLRKAVTRFQCCCLDWKAGPESSLLSHFELAHRQQGDTGPRVFFFLICPESPLKAVCGGLPLHLKRPLLLRI